MPKKIQNFSKIKKKSKNNQQKLILYLCVYEGCLLYFGISGQKQILIIKNRFIVFLNIPD